MKEEEKELLAKVKEAAKETAKEKVSEAMADLETKMKAFASKEEVDAFKTLVDGAKTEEQFTSVKSAIDGIEKTVKSLTESAPTKEKSDAILDYLTKNKESITNFQKEKKSTFSIKTVNKDFSLGGSFEDDASGIPFLPVDFKSDIAATPDIRTQFNILDYVTVGSTNERTVSWIEEKSETGAALFIDECVAKPEVSKEWTRNSAKVQKVADFSKVCEEVLWYLPRMRQLIEQFLRKLVYVSMQEAILNGDGIGNNLLGLIPQATAFVAGAKAASVEKANFSDAIRAVASQIKCLGYLPNCAFVNCDDMFHFESIKDANGQYLDAPLGGVTLIECPFIPVGEFLVGDCKMANVDFFQAIVSEWDRNDNDFRENAISVRSEALLACYIASNNVGAFVTDTFANVVTLINKP